MSNEGRTMVIAFDQIQHDKALQDYWVKRCFAAVIDAILILTPVYVLLGLMFVMSGSLMAMGGIILGFVWFLYSAFFEIGVGATIGKMLLGFKVVSTEGKLEPSQLIVRNVTKVFALLVVLDMLLAFLTETTDPRQRYVDRMAKTVLDFEKTH